MTPQERQLVGELFDRLAKLETTPRDPDAERVIADGLRRAPNAVYALVQTALVQDEALRRANDRIEELQAQLEGPQEPPRQQQGSFLDSMRDAVFGRAREPAGSVPSVRPPATQWSPEPSPRADYPGPGQGPAPGGPPQGPYPGGPGFGTGGSFLGTAASAAAGVIGGSLLLDGIRSMFGHHAASSGLGGFGGQDRNVFETVTERDRGSFFGGNETHRGLGHEGRVEHVSHDDSYAERGGEDDNFFGDDDGPGGDDSYDV